jgi:O-antigen ligase
MNLKVIQNKIKLFSLILIVVTLPYSITLNSIAIILFVLNWIIEGDFKSKWFRIKSNKTIWLFIGFYLIHIVGLLYTENTKSGMFDLEKKLSLLLFPIVLGTSQLNKTEIEKILKYFVAACLISTLMGLLKAIILYMYTGMTTYFFSAEPAIFMHRVYFSMYLLFCIYIIIYFIYTSENKHTLLFKCLLIFYISIFILLMASRLVVIFYFLNAIIFSLYFIIVRRKLWTGIVMGCLTLVILGGVLSIDKLRTIMKQTFIDLDKGNTIGNFSGPNQRVIQWKCALDIIKKNFWLGVGTGDTEDVLYKKYVKEKFRWGIKNRYNAHNQFFQTWLGLGVGGFLLFLSTMIIPFIIEKKQHNYLYLSFLFLFFACCLTESMLCAQKGIVFYAFFNSLLKFQVYKL